MRKLLAWLSFSLAACGSPGHAAGVEALSAKGEPLRAAFEAAHGKVRAILLASPT